MKKLEEFIMAILVSTIIGLAISYATILMTWVVDLTFLESVAVYHFWIHFASWVKSFSNTEDE